MKKKLPLTNGQRDKLWGDGGPYSQVHLIREHRILDDRESRVFVIVEVCINPLTYEIIKQNKKEFKDDEAILQFIDHADFRGQSFGYVSCAFQQELRSDKVLKDAELHVQYSRATIIKMHRFVMDLLDLGG